MSAYLVVEDLDVLENGLLGFITSVEVALIDQFDFQGAPKAFHGGIVIAAGASAHARDQAVVGERVPIEMTRKLAASVRMMDQSWCWSSLADGHGQSGEDERRIHACLHGPADQPSSVEVDDASDEQPAFIGGDVGDIRYPPLVRTRCRKILLEQVRRNRQIMVGIRGGDESRGGSQADAHAAHQAGNPLATDLLAVGEQIRMDSRTTIRLSALGVDHLNARSQTTISQ